MQVGIVFFFCAFLYLIPTLIAAGRQHNNQLAIFMLNLLGGWTVLGWIVAVVWACTDNRQKTEAARRS